MNQIEKWNISHSKIPKDKDVSSYAIEKEKSFPRNSNILDLGGGTGVDAIYFSKKEHKTTVADISDYALDIVKVKAKEANVDIETKQLILGNDKLPFPDNTFDIVYSRLAIHYFNKRDTARVIKEINRVLIINGKAYLTLKSPEDKDEMNFLKSNAQEVEENVFLDDGEIKSRYTIYQLEGLLRTAKIREYNVKEYTEDLGGRIDKVKSGNKVLLLNEITWTKQQ